MQEKPHRPPALITLENVILQSDSRCAPHPLNWTLRTGEQWAIIATHNAGSGDFNRQQLLAETLAGQRPVRSGRIHWHDVRSNDDVARPSKRSQPVPHRPQDHIAYVTFNRRPGGEANFHQARWHADLSQASPTVAEALSFPGVWRRNPFEVSRAPDHPQALEQFREHQADIITALEIKPLLQRRLHQLSDGEWRRLQISRALLRSPRLLILDHPLAGLDKDFRPRLDRALTRLTRQTELQLVLICTDTTMLMNVITHILVMREGQIIAQGPVHEMPAYALSQAPQPPSPETAAMIPTKPAVTAPALVRLNNIRITHNGVRVLKNVTWTVRQGEKWALIGPNGAGKSTLLSLILGDHPQAYANEIELFGQRRGSGESIWEIKRHIGWVAPELQRYHPPEVNVLDIVCSGYFDSLGLNQTPTQAQVARATAWMRRLGMAADLETPFYRLSKGNQRLALIARALVKDPKLLILDEPCQGLDAAHLHAVLTALEEIMVDPTRTLIYVTHHAQAFPRRLTHILELAQGQVIRQEGISASPR